MRLTQFMGDRLKTFRYNFGWSEWVPYIDGWVPRFAFVVPIVGYLVLFNDQVGGTVAFRNLVGGEFQDFWLSGQNRLRLVYFGLMALGISNLIYKWKRPYIFRFGLNQTEYTRTCLEAFTYQDFLRMHETIRSDGHLTPHGNYYDSEWEGFADAARNKGEGTELVERFGDWEAARRRYGSLLRSILAEWFFRGNILRRRWLAVCILFSSVGYVFLVIPSFDLFVKVLMSTISTLVVRGA